MNLIRDDGVLRMRRVLIIVLALTPWGAAHAGFKVVNTPSPSGESAGMAAAKEGFQPLDGGEAGDWRPSSQGFGISAISYTGTAPGVIETRRGMGHQVRLADALKQIAPDGWRGFGKPEVAETFNPNKTVNWVGGKPWTAVLDQLARTEGLTIEVDWNQKHLYVGKRRDVVAKASTPTAPAPVVAAKQMWEAREGSTFRSTMEEWSKRAGWTMVWPMQDLDYKFPAPLRFDGTIIDATSELTRLYEKADRPLAVVMHTTQKLIVFSEKGTSP